MFYDVELVTRKKNLYKIVRVSNSKCDIILRNLISQLDFNSCFLTVAKNRKKEDNHIFENSAHNKQKLTLGKSKVWFHM